MHNAFSLVTFTRIVERFFFLPRSEISAWQHLLPPRRMGLSTWKGSSRNGRHAKRPRPTCSRSLIKKSNYDNLINSITTEWLIHGEDSPEGFDRKTTEDVLHQPPLDGHVPGFEAAADVCELDSVLVNVMNRFKVVVVLIGSVTVSGKVF